MSIRCDSISIYDGIRYCDVDGTLSVGNGTSIHNNAEEELKSMHLVIPKSVYGKEVKAIGGWAFTENTKIVQVLIYARITHIDEYAFCRCINLISINIPSTCTKLAQYSLDQFDNNNQKESVGSLTVFFEPNSQISVFGKKAFAWKYTLFLYFCEAVQITYEDPEQFLNIKNLIIYSKETFTLKNYGTSIKTDMCFHLPSISCHMTLDIPVRINFIPLFYLVIYVI